MLSIITLLVGVLLVSCTSNTDEVAPPTPSSPPQVLPVIHHFDAVPISIDVGKYSTLNWSVAGAKQVEISPGLGVVGAVDSIVVSPAATTIYTLIASNESGSVTATVQVEVAKPPAVLPVIHYFNATQPDYGSATLSWEVSEAEHITLSDVFIKDKNSREPIQVDAIGSWKDEFSMIPQYTPGMWYTYTLTAASSAGTVTKTVDVYIKP
jgi:hypothetical protein